MSVFIHTGLIPAAVYAIVKLGIVSSPTLFLFKIALGAFENVNHLY